MTAWQHRLDDINKNDRIEIDMGGVAVRGHFKSIHRRVTEDGITWFIVVADRNVQEWIPTREIVNIRILKRAGE